MMYRRSHAPLSATKKFLSEDMLKFGILLYFASVNIGVSLGDNDYEISLINIDQQMLDSRITFKGKRCKREMDFDSSSNTTLMLHKTNITLVGIFR
jgi:hypothetical protein